MRLAFIADIHGNAIALDAVLRDIKLKDVDCLYVLGDICYRGPEPQSALNLIRSTHAEVIKGNADEWVVRGIKTNEVPGKVFELMDKEQKWTVSNLNEESIAYLEQLPSELHLEIDEMNIYGFHATPHSLFDVVLPDADDTTLKEKIITTNDDVFIYGHIYKPFVRFVEGKCIINTGSVGLPFDGCNKSSYVLLDVEADGIQVTIVRVAYEIDKVIKQFEKSDYPNKEEMINILKNSSVQ